MLVQLHQCTRAWCCLLLHCPRIYEFLQSWGLVNCKGAVREIMLPPSQGRSLSKHMPPGTASLYKFKVRIGLEAGMLWAPSVKKRWKGAHPCKHSKICVLARMQHCG